RAEPDIYGSIRIDGQARLLTADAGEPLIGLKFRTRLVVIHDERPEILRRDVGRQMDLISLTAIKRFTLRIYKCGGVLGADSNNLGRHRRSNAGGVVKHHGASV